MDRLDNIALECLQACEPERKLALTQQAGRAWRDGRLAEPAHAESLAAAESVAGRPQRPHLVAPRDLPRRSLGSEQGRAALLHSVAHIEFNAINLAWDAVYRFRGMPRQYYADWVSIAGDEARHFTMLVGRLADCGYAYGDFDAHNGLWDMACKTADSCLARMALVPRVLEARGLDVTPGMIERFRSIGDQRSVAVLQTILKEEVPHVAAGTRWFEWCCARAGVEPQATFRELIARHLSRPPKPPFNRAARLQAGFSHEELEQLESGA